MSLSEQNPQTGTNDKEGLPKHAEQATATHTEALAEEAKNASDSEHTMSLFRAIKLYPKAIGWSVLLSSTLIMEGYDLALLGSLYASPEFNKKFGTYNEASGKWAVSAAWQSGLSNGARAGEIFGLIIAGWASDRYGYKMTTIGSLILMICFIFVLFFAPNLPVLVVGEILCGKLRLLSRMSDTAELSPSLSRYSLGCISICHTCVCLRSGTYCPSTLSYHLHQQ